MTSIEASFRMSSFRAWITPLYVEATLGSGSQIALSSQSPEVCVMRTLSAACECDAPRKAMRMRRACGGDCAVAMAAEKARKARRSMPHYDTTRFGKHRGPKCSFGLARGRRLDALEYDSFAVRR